MKMIAIKELNFDYDSHPVLCDINFSVKPETICGLLGPNGSGKSTLLKCINGLLTPRRGRVWIGEKNIRHLSRNAIARIMAVVPQQTSVAFAFSALQMVLMGRAARIRATGRPSSKDVCEAEEVLCDLGIIHLKNRPFNALSGGERQIVLLARALFQSPAIMLLDEPTAHLDFKNQYLIMELVKELTRRHHLTTLITLHDPNLAARYCGQVVMLKQGRVHRKGTMADVFDQSAIETLYGMSVSIHNDHNGGRGQWFVTPTTRQAGFPERSKADCAVRRTP